jgi:hypothetical protein
MIFFKKVSNFFFLNFKIKIFLSEFVSEIENWKFKKIFIFLKKSEIFEIFTKFFFEFRTPFFKKSYLSLSTDYTCKFLILPSFKHREFSENDLNFDLADI